MAARNRAMTFAFNQKRFVMKTFKCISVAILMSSTATMNAQESIPVVPSVNLNGPRVGITYVGPGKAADVLRNTFDAQPLLSQFGWQFETRFFTLPTGTAGLVEAVLLVAGLEQGLFLPSGSMLIGIRNARGLEFGFGPNISVTGAALAIAAGFNYSTGGINFPVNVAVVSSDKGIRTSLLVGFNARKR